MIKALIFDWGNTIMVDFGHRGPMYTWEKVAWVPGAEEALISLHDKYICCIATNASHSGTDDMIRALKRVDAERFFRHFFSSNDLGVAKPDPAFFLKICEAIGEKPGNCVMIGDLYHRDILGAHEAGMKTVLFSPTGGPADYPLAHAVIPDMARLPDVIEEL